MALIIISFKSFSQFTVSATATTPTICLGGSTQLTATASPINYTGASIAYNMEPSAGDNILCHAGITDVPRSAGINLDDCRWDNISLPFNFTFYGNTYSSVNISSNGWVGMGSTSSVTTGFGQTIPNAAAANNTIFAMLTDLTFSGAGGGQIEYFTGGSFPNRTFCILYTGAKFISGGGLADIEIILYENSNEIEIHTNFITANTTLAKTEGIENSGGTVALAYPGRNNVANWGAAGQTAYRFTPENITYSWSPSTGLSSTTGKTVTATPTVTTTYTVTATNSVPTNANNTVTVTIDPASNIPAGTPGGPTLSHYISVSPTGTYYRDMTNCNIISYILPSGASPVSNSINTMVKVDVNSTKRGTPDLYLARKYDIEPLVSPSTSTATVTLYYLQSEFDNFNARAVDSGHKLLPTGPADATGIGNLILRQFHGTGTNPGNYSGGMVNFTTATPGFSVSWNSTYSRWEVVVPVNGFSGFYITSQKSGVVPVKLVYFRGSQSGKQHFLTWFSECTSTEAKFELERSSDGVHYTSLTKITATQARCAQPFDFTDIAPAPGINYYRLKSIDVDGRYAYSNIVTLTLKDKGYKLQNIAPNPVGKEDAVLKINAGDKATVQISVTDFSGRVISKQTVQLQTGINAVVLNTSGLSAGAYQVTSHCTNEKPQTIRLIKQ